MPISIARCLYVSLTIAAALSAPDAHALSIDAIVDSSAYACGEAASIAVTLESDPVWSWTCAGTPVICVQSSEFAVYDLGTGNLLFSCNTQTPVLEIPIFLDSFD